MRRVQAIEFEDYDWFPAVIRDAMTDFFSLQMTQFDIYGSVVPLLAAFLEVTIGGPIGLAFMPPMIQPRRAPEAGGRSVQSPLV